MTLAANPRPALSVIVAVYRCKDTLAELHSRLSAVLPKSVQSYEIIFVDDGCPENSWTEIERLAAEDPRVRGVKLSRNFGQAIAISAGLKECDGERAVVMDGDLQDPPEAIPMLLEAAEGGAALVYAKRKSDHQSFARLQLGKLYFQFLKMISGRAVDPGYGTFTLLSRNVIDAYTQFSEPNRHYLFILYWLGFEGIDVEYIRERRTIGRSSYPFWKLLKHSYAGLIFYSESLLRTFMLTTLVMVLLSLSFPFGSGVIREIQLALFGIVLAAALSILGLYASTILDYSKRRPLFVVFKRAGTRPSSSAASLLEPRTNISSGLDEPVPTKRNISIASKAGG